MKKFSKLLFLILIFGFWLRIHRLSELFYFNMDEALLAFRGWGLWTLKRFFIIGGISPLGFHLPPYFYWFSALFLPILDFSPLIWGYLASFLALLTILALFFLVRKIVDEKTALVAAFLYTTSFNAIFYDRHYWPLVFNPLLTILTLALLASKFYYRWFILALILVFAISADPSNLPLLILGIYELFKKKVSKKNKLGFSLTFLILFFLPLIIFDLRHAGSNFQGLNLFLRRSQELRLTWQGILNALLLIPKALGQFWYTGETNISYFHTYCLKYALARQFDQPFFLQIISLIFLLIFSFQWRKKERFFINLLLIYAIGLLIYGGVLGRPLFDHYLAGLLPIFALFTARALTKFWPATLLILAFFFFVNFRQFLKSTNPYGLAETKKAINWTIQEIDNKEFALDTLSKCFRFNGLRYLYEIKNRAPLISHLDPDFFWLYRRPPANFFPELVVIFSDKEVTPDLPVIKKNFFGAWHVYLLDNKNLKYQIEGLR